MLKKIICFSIATLLIALTVVLILQAVHLHQIEVAAQVAKVGFYKQDVYLNYGRHVATTLCIVGAAVSGISAGTSVIIGLVDQ